VIVLDTTVLLYAKGADHPLRDPARRLIAAVTDGDIEATTTAEVIQEFVHVRARRRGRTEAVTLGCDYAELLSPLVTVTAEQLRRGLEIFTRCERLGAFDAVLAAAALCLEADALVSADTAFVTVPALTHVNPNEQGVAELLSEQPGEAPAAEPR
jgi:predicted nucleic acid-binding protein